MSNEVAVKVDTSVAGPVDPWSREQIDLLKRTICKDASDDELKLFLHVVKRSGLDPFARQIHAVKRWNDKANRFDMMIQTGIDGFRLTAERTGAYAGSDDAVFDDEKEPGKATVTVYKMVGGARCPFTATARWAEYFPGDKQGFMWRKMPCVMLAKCAEALALRKAFPAELSAVYSPEELERSGVEDLSRGPGRILPGEPGPEDGCAFNDDEYKIDFGQWNRKSLNEIYRDPKIGPREMAAYVHYLERPEIIAKRKPDQVPKVARFIEECERFLAAKENAPLEPGSNG